MFKLIKILNSGSNVPETVNMTYGGIGGKKGAPLSLYEGNVCECAETEMPKYVALKDPQDFDSQLMCYRITPDMVFETTITGTPSDSLLGQKVTLYKNDGCIVTGVTDNTNSGVATVIALNGARKSGDKISVSFI